MSEARADGYLPPHQPNCLGCGDENPAAMGLRLRIEGDRVKGDVTLDRRQEGAPGFAHGGAVATILDDTLGTLLLVVRRPAVTAKLEVNYRRPAFIDRRFEVEAWLERAEGRKLHLAGELRDRGELIADARGLFLEVELDHFLQSGANPPMEWLEQTEGERPTLPW